MRLSIRLGSACAALAALLVLAGVAAAQSDNGVYGGYVGSTAWFRTMREGARNQAMLRELMHGHSSRRGRLPRGYIEVAGVIQFRDGKNPFPDGKLPDLRIIATDTAADPVERAPYVGRHRAFYTVLKRGLTYDVRWMYYLGSKETWATIRVPGNAPAQEVIHLTYSVATRASKAAKPGASATPPPDADHFDTSGLPNPPTTFAEQMLWSSIHSASTRPLKAMAHQKLANYYAAHGKPGLAAKERRKAAYWSGDEAAAAPQAPSAAAPTRPAPVSQPHAGDHGHRTPKPTPSHPVAPAPAKTSSGTCAGRRIRRGVYAMTGRCLTVTDASGRGALGVGIIEKDNDVIPVLHVAILTPTDVTNVTVEQSGKVGAYPWKDYLHAVGRSGKDWQFSLQQTNYSEVYRVLIKSRALAADGLADPGSGITEIDWYMPK